MTDVEPEELERLRRGVYRREATDEDAERYRAARRASQESSRTGEPPASGAAPRHRRLRSTAVAAAALAAAALIGALAAPHRPASPARSSTTANVPAGATRSTLVGSARDLRAASVLVDGRPQAAQRASGTGTAAVPLGAEWSADRGGRLLIRLESDAADPIGWSAVRPLFGADGRAVREVVAQAAAAPRDVGAVPTLTPFSGAPPVSVVVRAPDGVRWTITTALVDRAS